MNFLELVTQQYPEQFIPEKQFTFLLEAWNAGQAAERERIKSRVKEAAEDLWCIRSEVVEEVEGELKRVPYSLYIGPSLNTMEEFVNRLLEEE
jgi:hypothetical protein